MENREEKMETVQYAPPATVKWNQYLIDGNLKSWNGEMEQVCSPMGDVSGDGVVNRTYLGASP